jgi:magnesium-transporting ATPase (P-type)
MTTFHSLSIDDTYSELNSNEQGLTEQEAALRLQHYGRNRLRPPEKKSALKRFLNQFHNVLIYALLVSSCITFFLGHYTDTGVILGVIVINAIIGYIQEGKAEKSLDAIRKMLSLQATVLRDGKTLPVDAELLVPGDIISLQTGDKIPADLRLLQADNLEAQEAALTGESLSVTKSTDPIPEDSPLAERKSMAYAGTYISKGQGTGIVVATGDATELGHISALLHETEDIETPLIQRINHLGKKLVILILIVSAFTFIYGVWVRHFSYEEMFMAVIGIAVAAIPEGLPAIITITLAIGVQRMAARNSIIRHLPAVETLGSVDVICTDKTGTLTRNELSVREVVTGSHRFEVEGSGYEPEGQITYEGHIVNRNDYPVLLEISQAALLNNDAELTIKDGEWVLSGDPTEGALLSFALKSGHVKQHLETTWPRTDIIPFDSAHSFMATLHHNAAGEGVIYVKGAPEKLLEMCSNELHDDGSISPLRYDYWHEQLQNMASTGQRVLAEAMKFTHTDHRELELHHVGQDLVMLGLIGIMDIPREEAKTAIAECYQAGITVKMITGDNAATASAIGRELGLKETSNIITGKDIETLSDEQLAEATENTHIYARTSPEQKLRLVKALQSKHHIVSMTGDGVNDAPALKQADIGVAMGGVGTEVAKEAAEIILVDDNFATIVHAVEEGRTTFNNIRKAIIFILTTDAAEAAIIILAILMGMHLPISPVQILWVNMITAVTLSLPLAVEPINPEVMQYPPRKMKDPLFGKVMLLQSLFVALTMMAGTIGLFLWEQHQGSSYSISQTVAVNTLVLFEASYLLSIRHSKRYALSKGAFSSNPYIFLSILCVVFFQLLFTYAPFMQKLFGTSPLGLKQWGEIITIAASLFIILELRKWLYRLK